MTSDIVSIMSSAADSIEEQEQGRVGELRYVTQHFRTLQGLRTFPFWLSVFSVSLVMHPGAGVRMPVGALAIRVGILVAGFIAWQFFLTSWYRRRYGFVAGLRAPRPRGNAAPFFFAGCLCLMAFPMVSGRQGTLGMLAMLAGWVIPICLAPVPASGILRIRRSMYILALTAVTGITALSWFVPGMALLAFQVPSGIFLVASLYDAWLLERLLGPGSQGAAASA